MTTSAEAFNCAVLSYTGVIHTLTINFPRAVHRNLLHPRYALRQVFNISPLKACRGAAGQVYDALFRLGTYSSADAGMLSSFCRANHRSNTTAFMWRAWIDLANRGDRKDPQSGETGAIASKGNPDTARNAAGMWGPEWRITTSRLPQSIHIDDPKSAYSLGRVNTLL